MHIYTHIHTLIHTYVHAHTHTHAHAHTHTRTCMHTHTCTHTHACTHLHTLAPSPLPPGHARFLPNGMRWRDLFDMVIVMARKPDFFNYNMSLYEVVTEDGLMR